MSPQPIFADGIYRSSDSGLPIRRWCRERLQQWSVPRSLMPFKTSLGRRTVVCAGTGIALPPVAIVSGSGLNTATSLSLAFAMRARRRLFLVDLPGQPGPSSAYGPPHGHFSAYGAWRSELLPRLTEPYRGLVVRRARRLAIGIALMVALPFGLYAQSNWAIVQLFLHGGSFGTSDAEFGHDISFYVFDLPLYRMVLNWLFIVVFLALIANLCAQYLFGGIRVQRKDKLPVRTSSPSSNPASTTGR